MANQTELVRRANRINEANEVLRKSAQYDSVSMEDLIEALYCCSQIIEANNPAHAYMSKHIDKIAKTAVDDLLENSLL